MNTDKKKTQIPFHPAWSYATEQQISRLKQSIHPNERKRILEQIKKQAKAQGKI
jgi:hypothetical protein